MAKSHCAMELKSKQIICKLRGIYDNDPVLYVVSDNVWAVFIAQSTDFEDVGKESPLTYCIGKKDYLLPSPYSLYFFPSSWS